MYPKPSLIRDGYLTVSKAPEHRIYWQEYGKPDGAPVMIMHGGPGSGAMTDQAKLFDPNHYRIIMFDQRGAGKSEPHASLAQNTTPALIDDIIQLRKALNIKEKMHLFGGSWGSTLALVYAIQFPQHVISLTLYGIFLGREEDILSFYQANAANLSTPLANHAVQSELADEWERYVTFIPQNERTDMLAAYRQRLNADDPALRLTASTHWNRWEKAASTKIYDKAAASKTPEEAYNLAHARIENHYFNHGLFLSEDGSLKQDYILDHVEKLKHIPIAIVQGAYDKVCPKTQAQALYDALAAFGNDKITLTLIETAGHTMRDPGMIEALIKATDGFRKVR